MNMLNGLGRKIPVIFSIFQQAVVSNLQTSVSQEDLSELFGDVGPLRRVKMLGPGSAEIVFLNKVCFLICFEKEKKTIFLAFPACF